jgi:hypothetical protein
MSKLIKVFHPRVAMFMVAIPFMMLCPLAIFSILFGFPLESWRNNDLLDNFESAFTKIEIPKDVNQIGVTRSFLGGFDDVKKCDFVSVKLFESKNKLEDFSKSIQENYQKLTNVEDPDERVNGFKYLYDAGVDSIGLKVLPLNKEENFLKGDFEVTDLKTNFKLTKDLNDYEGNVFVVYLMHLNKYSSRDLRCAK